MEKLKAIEGKLTLLLKRVDQLKPYEVFDEVSTELKSIEEKLYEIADLVEVIEAKLEL